MVGLSDTAKQKIIAIGGPTATGKTSLSVQLAQRFDGEIISADSMQIYSGLDVGTAKATVAEKQGIPHHLVDICTPEQSFSVADFVKEADGAVTQITAKGHLPIVAGGTGLYVTSMINGIGFADNTSDPAIRAALQKQADREGKAAMYEELKIIDPEYAAAVHPNNLPRVLRAIELYKATGRRMSEERLKAKPVEPRYRALMLCLTYSDRELLYKHIDARVDKMLNDGVLTEAEQVYQNRQIYRTAAQAIGYKEFFPYFEGTKSIEECSARLKQATRRYAKRQLTWFRNQNDAVWLNVDEPGLGERASALVERFLNE